GDGVIPQYPRRSASRVDLIAVPERAGYRRRRRQYLRDAGRVPTRMPLGSVRHADGIRVHILVIGYGRVGGRAETNRRWHTGCRSTGAKEQFWVAGVAPNRMREVYCCQSGVVTPENPTEL